MRRGLVDLDALVPVLSQLTECGPPGQVAPRSVDHSPDELGIPVGDFDPEAGLRTRRIARLTTIQSYIDDLGRELRQLKWNDPEKNEVHAHLRKLNGEVDAIKAKLSESFVPQHGRTQLIGPGLFLATKLFNVRGKNVPRISDVTFPLARAGVTCVYEGPELRQLDGHVFMTLLNMMRPYSVHLRVTFDPEGMCEEVFGYYDGKARLRLRDVIRRLMKAIVMFPEFTVHLVDRFDHPSRGLWSVKMDTDLVRLFQASPHVWLDAARRRNLPEGLATWLYCYVRTQSRLIPTRLTTLRDDSGSDCADDLNFKRRLTPALDALVERQVIDPGWTIRDGVLRWRKPQKDVECIEAAEEVPKPDA